jgi:transposase
MDQQSGWGGGDTRKLPADALERLRRRVVAAVESGISQSHVARMFGVSRKTVGTWVRAYQAHGEQAFRPRRRGRRTGEQLALSAAQQAWVVKTVASSPPDQVGLPYLVWTRPAIADLLRREFAITLSPATIDHYLLRWEMITKTPPLALPRDSPAPGPVHAALWMAWTCPRSLTGSELMHALVAVTNRGMLLFLASERPFDRERLADFRTRLRVQLARDVRLVVRVWPTEHYPLLGRWRTEDRNVTVHLATH